MPEDDRGVTRDLHRKLGVDLFNHVWELLEKPGRTKEEDERMVHAAHASRYHWIHAGEAANHATGEWQIARVYSVLGRAEPALHHARRCLEILEEAGIRGFHRASACEGLAKAHSVAGHVEECLRYIELAKAESESITDEEDRKVLFDQLREIPEYRD